MQNHHAVIRPYDPATDTEKLSQIWLDAALIAHAFIGEETLRAQRSLIEDVYLPKAETSVACVGGEPAGFISLLGDFVGGLFVAPAFQGQGIGRMLIEHALARTNELSLEVYTANEGAMRFYQRLGFVEQSRRPLDNEGLPFENALMRYGG